MFGLSAFSNKGIKRTQKIIVCVLVLMLMTQLVTPLASASLNTTSLTTTEVGESINSDYGTGESGVVDANNTSKTMLDYFKSQRDLNVNSLSQDEMKVYGIFISNFYKPYETTVESISAQGGVSKQISEKFFGSAGNEPKVMEVNGKITEAITNGLTNTPADWGMYSSKDFATQGSPMKGSTLLKKIAGANEASIYRKDGSVIFNMQDPVTLAAWKILFGYSPSMFLSESAGIRKASAMYMDGFGNVWGAPEGVTDVGKYVLILPASMNPLLYGGKMPLVNTIANGALLNVDSQKLSTGSIVKPYYNYLDHVKSNGVTSIIGIQSPSSYMGNSDTLFKTSGGSSAKKQVEAMATETVGDISAGVKMVYISYDVTDERNAFVGIDSMKMSTDQNKALVQNLTSTDMFALNQLSDKMYFFDTSQKNQAADSSFGDWSDPNSMSLEVNLFNYNQGGKFTFFNNSYVASPYNTMLGELKNGKSIDSYLKDKTSYKTSSSEYKELANMLQGKGISDLGAYSKGVKSLVEASKNTEYFSSGATSRYALRYPTKSFLGIKFSSKAGGFMLTKNDSVAVEISAYKNQNWFKEIFSTAGVTNTKLPFFTSSSSDGTGVLSGTTKAEKDRAEEFFYLLYSYRIFTTNKVYLDAIQKNLTPKGTAINGGLGAGKSSTAKADVTNSFAGMYWAYLKEFINVTVSSDGNFSSSSFSVTGLPNMTISVTGSGFDSQNLFVDSTSDSSGAISGEDMTQELIKRMYALTSPEINVEKMQVAEAMMDSVLLSTHRGMTNSWVNGTSVLGTMDGEGYAQSYDYIKSPSLSELPFVNGILKDYLYIYLTAMLIALVFLTLLTLLGVYSLLQGFLMFGVLALVLLLPQYFVGGVSTVANMYGDKVMSERFTFWAIAEHQTTSNSLAKATATGASTDTVIENAMKDASNMNGQGNAQNSPTGVTLRWMAPKRDDIFNQLFTDSYDNSLLTSNGSMFKWLFSSYFYKEEFVYDDPLATYIYKPYTTLASDAKANYDNFLSNVEAVSKSNAMANIEAYKVNNAVFDESRFMLWYTPSEVTSQEVDGEMLKRLQVARPMYTTDTEEQANTYRYWGLTNTDISRDILRSEYTIDGAGTSVDQNDPVYRAFAGLTESPYYYFYNVLKYRYSSGTQTGSSFKSALLKENVFLATDVNHPDLYGQLKDFLDLEGLFTYVIPYLNQANSYVDGWTNVYGTDISTFNFTEGMEGEQVSDTAVTMAESFQYENARKEALGRVWKLYSPWVDQLYSQVHSGSIKVTTKEKAYVADPLNPSTYSQVGRDMVFSPADMEAEYLDFGYTSPVEDKIIEVTQKTYEDLMYLNNYRDFSDESLLSMAAMLATFNFNEVFSRSGVIGTQSLLYPQSFELKNFNYDAYMRMAILNASNESLEGDKDLYERVLGKTSFLTGVLLIVKNVFGLYVVPYLRIFSLMLLFFLTFAFVLVSVLTPPIQLGERVISTLAYPALAYMVITMIFTKCIAMFLGEGETAYVGARLSSFGLTDPSSSIFGMLAIDAIYSILLMVLIFFLARMLKDNVIMLFKLLKGIVGQVIKNLTAKIGNMKSDGVSASGDMNSKGGVKAEKGRIRGTFAKGFDTGMGLIKRHKHRKDTKERKKIQKLQGAYYSDWLEERTTGDKTTNGEGSSGEGSTTSTTDGEQYTNKEETKASRYQGSNEGQGETTTNASNVNISGATVNATTQAEDDGATLSRKEHRNQVRSDKRKEKVTNIKSALENLLANNEGKIQYLKNSTAMATDRFGTPIKTGAVTMAGAVASKAKRATANRKAQEQLRRSARANSKNIEMLRNQTSTTRNSASEVKTGSVGVRVALEKARKRRNKQLKKKQNR